MTLDLRSPLTLPCGVTIPNRLCKSAMTEGLADPQLRATDAHVRLYRQWSESGIGLLITGNVMIDQRVLERPGNVAIDGNGGEAALKAWAAAGTAGGGQLWMQISHAGRQSPWYVTREPLAASAVKLDLMANYARPRALREDEILDFIARFARTARTARDCGFTGVQVHAAHGYLLSSFLSPATNQRQDRWGGSLDNRARFLLETLRAVRTAVGDDFPVGVKLNSDDFRKGGFSHQDCLQVVHWLNDAQVDLLEISGGTYEQPRLLGYTGKTESAELPKASTRAREAYFLDYAEAIRRIARMPLLVTGGFRSRAGMDAALAEGHCDMVGIARPLTVEPDIARPLLAGSLAELPRYEQQLRLGRHRWLGGASPLFPIRLLTIFGQQGWYYQQLIRLGRGLAPRPRMGLFGGLIGYLVDEYRSAWRMHRARRQGATKTG
jgi:2,4-dienoyl-CoA reductase-like NADH-dependent reductase (Old Yellow Enzyme family)